MRKKDLESGMILETRDGDRYLLTNGVMRDFTGYMSLDDYSNDLKYEHSKGYDIIKVYKDTMAYSLTVIFKYDFLTLIWERKETKLTNREIEVLKALNTLGYTYIARDKNGELYGHDEMPSKYTNDWWDGSTNHHSIPEDDNLFKFIKWEDDEPAKIDDLLKGV